METGLSILSGGLDSVVATALARQEMKISLTVTFNYGQRAAVQEKEAAGFFSKKWGTRHLHLHLPFLAQIGESALTSHKSRMPSIEITQLDDATLTQKTAVAVWIPNRNGIFINIAAAFAESEGLKWIITGFNKEEAATFPDNSQEFVEAVNCALQYSTLKTPKVVSPVSTMDKVEILKKALEFEINIEKIWCCYERGEKWCGRCESCARTFRAMKKLEVFEKYKNCFQ